MCRAKKKVKKFDMSYTSKEIAHQEDYFFIKWYTKLVLEGKFPIVNFAQPDSNRSHKATTIIEASLANVWCGLSRFLHAEAIHHDGHREKYLIETAFLSSAYKRFITKFGQPVRESLFSKKIKDRPKVPNKRLIFFFTD